MLNGYYGAGIFWCRSPLGSNVDQQYLSTNEEGVESGCFRQDALSDSRGAAIAQFKRYTIKRQR
jgi:hypothetical protein